ncbi:MAG: DNA polymerase III subunit alpha, partial [Candidatus Omnitrophica bacterium]|nr:DNA polymerase III subunit alpha [Candidatus Omnitrophota bacterium]
DGACHLDRLIDKATQYKLPGLAITDHGNLFGAIKFYTQCISKGIKPIIGCEVYVAPESRFKKDYKQSEDSNYHLILLAKNEEGYRNLLKLTSFGYLEGFYYKPRIDKELLSLYNKGLIGLSACLNGEIATNILSDNIKGAYRCADDYLNIFGKGNFYLEIMDNGLEEQKVVNNCLLELSKDLDIPIVASNDVHYIDRIEAFAHEVLLCIQTQTTLDDPKRLKFGSDTFYFRSPWEMKDIFKDIPLALKNSLEIMQKCNLILDFSKVYLPRFPLPLGEKNDYEYLRKLCEENLRKRYPHPTKEVYERLNYELKMIEKVGFSSYFLIIWDLVEFAKKNRIPTGPGRGSVAGSIVSYILGITDIDPLRYRLLFERFINPERVSMPDIDLDFCYEKRGYILDYVIKKYGKDNVAQIITFGTMLARAVVRDVGRVMGLSYSEVDRIAKMIPSGVGHSINLNEALKVSPELNDAYNNDQTVKKLIDVAIQLEGLSRHSSTHAAGVVISDIPLIERIPLIKGSNDEIITGFEMDSLEKIGLLKMDFLGLKTLTVINSTLEIIKRTRNIDIDINSVSLDDHNTYDLLCKGETIGVFQLESRGMRELLKRIAPRKFEDLIAILALYRPGPLGSGMVEDYIERKQGKKPISYIHPKLESILRETYGIILYQEQTMQIASELAGFSLAQSDLLRKAIGKKIPEIMEEQKSLFIEGCKKNKIPVNIANVIFDLIDYFSGYGFNKSHSTAYALISYRTAYLKANFKVEFMAALLTSERNNTDKIVEYVNEARRMGIKVLPPDINESFAHFTVTNDGNIRFGLLAIKNVGESALENIITVRKQKKFESFFDFYERVDPKTVNRKVSESLIKSGAMDSFGIKRSQMMVLLDKLLDRNYKKVVDKQQLCFFNTSFKEDIPDMEEWPIVQLLNFEKSLLGIYVSAHPLHLYDKLREYLPVKTISSICENKIIKESLVMGVISEIKLITTCKNERMAFVKLEDESGSIEIVVFPKVYETVYPYLSETKVVLVKGVPQFKDTSINFIANDIFLAENVFSKVKGLEIKVNGKIDLKRIKEIFLRNKGTVPIYFVLNNNKGLKIKTSQDFQISINESLLKEIGDAIGEGNFLLTL